MKIIGTNEDGLICVMSKAELAALMGRSEYSMSNANEFKTGTAYDLKERLGYVRELDGLPDTAAKMSGVLDAMRAQMDKVLRLTENTTFQRLNEKKPK